MSGSPPLCPPVPSAQHVCGGGGDGEPGLDEARAVSLESLCSEGGPRPAQSYPPVGPPLRGARGSRSVCFAKWGSRLPFWPSELVLASTGALPVGTLDQQWPRWEMCQPRVEPWAGRGRGLPFWVQRARQGSLQGHTAQGLLPQSRGTLVSFLRPPGPGGSASWRQPVGSLCPPVPAALVWAHRDSPSFTLPGELCCSVGRAGREEKRCFRMKSY